MVLLGAVRTSFDITPLPPQLAFLSQPSDTVADAIILPAVQVEIQDASGARITDATNTVFISIQSDPNGGSSVLSGTEDIGSGFFQKAAVAGVATFSDLSIDLVGSGFSLQAASAGFDPIISDDFEVVLSAVAEPDDLVSWWPGDGDADDISGSDDGTLESTAGFATGLVGQAFSFNGTSDSVNVGTSVAQGVTALTYEAWVNPDDVSSPHGMIVGRLLANQMALADNGHLYAIR